MKLGTGFIAWVGIAEKAFRVRGQRSFCRSRRWPDLLTCITFRRRDVEAGLFSDKQGWNRSDRFFGNVGRDVVSWFTDHYGRYTVGLYQHSFRSNQYCRQHCLRTVFCDRWCLSVNRLYGTTGFGLNSVPEDTPFPRVIMYECLHQACCNIDGNLLPQSVICFSELLGHPRRAAVLFCHLTSSLRDRQTYPRQKYGTTYLLGYLAPSHPFPTFYEDEKVRNLAAIFWPQSSVSRSGFQMEH